MKKYFSPILSHALAALIAVVITLIIVFTSVLGSQGKLAELQTLIDKKYIGDVDWESVEDAAASAIVEALGDRWSYYLSAEEYVTHMEQSNNAFVGIGVSVAVRKDNQGLDVVSVTEGGPAEEAGVCPGDILIAIDGQSVIGMNTSQVRDRIRGEQGTTVTLTVLRVGERYDFTVTRRYIETPVATGKLLEGNIGLVTIENFEARCASETIAAIEALREQGAEKLIFDVRYNPGGYKNELVEVLDYLLPKGVLFRSEYYDGSVSTDHSDAAYLDMPMAVLVNGGSYSAAEFFAAALWEYEAAVVIGEQTTGKGYFQNVFKLSDGSAVGLSIGKYYTPKLGISLEGVGITPDVLVEIKNSEIAQGIYNGTLDPMEDPQILAAIGVLQGQ
ncbi:MAG: S41 family peptidase [Ruminococcaceae bacterium]|nr:S41 family peptidase [Oscillospiraceae bacterium]